MKKKLSRLTIHPASVQYWVNRTFEYAKTLLWPDQAFSKTEITHIKYLIERLYKNISAQSFQYAALNRFRHLKTQMILHSFALKTHPVAPPFIIFDQHNPQSIFYKSEGVFTPFYQWQICLN